jgi:hypothetical protein
MAKRKINFKAGTPVNMGDFPINISDETNEKMKELMSKVLEEFPPGLELPMPTPLDIHFLHQEGTDRWMSLFVLANPNTEPSENNMRVEALMDFSTLQRVAREGQEPMWEWMRNVAAMTCVQAVLRGQGLPNRIGLQISDAVRAHDVDQDPEFAKMINDAAHALAKQALMGREVSE